MADDQTAATTAAASEGENNISPEEASRTLVTGAAML